MSEYQRFLADSGENKRYEYELNENSYVLDVGGYRGDFADNIYNLFGCNIFIFDPVFGERLIERFIDNEKITVFEFGLSDSTCNKYIYISEDSTSLHREIGMKRQIKLWDVRDFMRWHLMRDIDLIKINIEGEEFALLECMIKNNLISKFKNIQVQFHKFFPLAEERMKAIHDKLKLTHELTWQYEFIWENWRLK